MSNPNWSVLAEGSVGDGGDIGGRVGALRRERATRGPVTIVYEARDEQHNNAAVLAELVRGG
jgi:hypothetical protein